MQASLRTFRPCWGCGSGLVSPSSTAALSSPRPSPLAPCSPSWVPCSPARQHRVQGGPTRRKRGPDTDSLTDPRGVINPGLLPQPSMAFQPWESHLQPLLQPPAEPGLRAHQSQSSELPRAKPALRHRSHHLPTISAISSAENSKKCKPGSTGRLQTVSVIRKASTQRRGEPCPPSKACCCRFPIPTFTPPAVGAVFLLLSPLTAPKMTFFASLPPKPPFSPPFRGSADQPALPKHFSALNPIQEQISRADVMPGAKPPPQKAAINNTARNTAVLSSTDWQRCFQQQLLLNYCNYRKGCVHKVEKSSGAAGGTHPPPPPIPNYEP